MTRKLTAEQIERLLLLHSDGSYNVDIAREIGCDKTTVGKYLKKHNLEANKLISKEFINKVRRLHQQGHTREEISRRLNTSWNTIDKVLKSEGIQPNKVYVECQDDDLFNVNRERLEQLHFEGLSNKEISEILGVQPITIRIWLDKLHLKSHRGTVEKIIKDSLDKILEKHQEGETAAQIARDIGVQPDVLYRLLRKKGFTPNGKLILESDEYGMSVCRVCGETLPTEEFPKTSDGYNHTFCKPCRRLRQRSYLDTSIENYLNRRAGNIRNQRDVSSQITGEYLLQIYKRQEGVCFYTGHELLWGTGHPANDRRILSVDKVIPTKGYVEGNLVLCTRRANTVKNDLTLEEMKLWMPPWYNLIMAAFNTGTLY